jgi:hypothetical protein
LSNPGAAGVRWRIEPGALVLDERLRTSFQRCTKPTGGYFENPPTSLGSLPPAPDANGALFLPMAENEAMWIGLTAVSPQSAVAISVAVETQEHGTLDAISGRPWTEEGFASIAVRDHHAIDGVFRDGHSVWAFQSEPAMGDIPCCKALIFLLLSSHVSQKAEQLSKTTRIQLTNYGRFFALTGCRPPAPLDLNSGYGGWLLP